MCILVMESAQQECLQMVPEVLIADSSAGTKLPCWLVQYKVVKILVEVSLEVLEK